MPILLSSIDFGFDPFAFAIACIAFWIAYIEHRRNNKTEISLLSIRSSFGHNVRENQRNPFDHLEIVLLNKGLPLYGPKVQLTYEQSDYQGTMSVELSSDSTDEQAEFRRGMYATFYLKSYQMHDRMQESLFDLSDTTLQNARFRIFSQGFLAHEIRIGGWRNKLLARWNRRAFKMNWRRKRYVFDSKGTKMLHAPKLFPEFINLNKEVMCFVDGMKRTTQRNSDESSAK